MIIDDINLSLATDLVLALMVVEVHLVQDPDLQGRGVQVEGTSLGFLLEDCQLFWKVL